MTVIELVVGLLLLGVAIFFILNTSGPAQRQIAAVTGSELQSVVNSCQIAVSSGASLDYCKFSNVKDEKGITQYVNCNYPAVKSVIGNALVCDVKAEVAECQVLKSSGVDVTSTAVNGGKCALDAAKANVASWTSAAGGAPVPV